MKSDPQISQFTIVALKKLTMAAITDEEFQQMFLTMANDATGVEAARQDSRSILEAFNRILAKHGQYKDLTKEDIYVTGACLVSNICLGTNRITNILFD